MSAPTSDLKCRRKGCGRKRKGKSDQRPYCSAQCFWAAKHHREADSLLANLGPSPEIDGYLLATVELNRALDRVMSHRANLRRLAADAGVSDSGWDALVRGVQQATGQSVEDTAAAG
jgi:hypothetical protein